MQFAFVCTVKNRNNNVKLGSNEPRTEKKNKIKKNNVK